MRAEVNTDALRGGQFEATSTARGPCSISDLVRGETIQRVATPSALLVALPEQLAARCTAVLGSTGLRVLRMGHVAAACERIPVVMPQLVVVSSGAGTLAEPDLEMITDRCVAVGAQLMQIEDGVPTATLASELRQAASAALLRAMQGS